MPKKLKVYGGELWLGRKQCRAVVACAGLDELARRVQMSRYFLSNWWCETGNAVEVTIALSNPGQVFAASGVDSEDFVPVERQNGVWAPVHKN